MSGKMLAFFSVLVLLVSACAARRDVNPHFDAVECWFEIPAGANVTCGYVNVREDRSKPVTSANTIQLAVAVFHSTSKSPAPDPVVYQVGGPGGHLLVLVPHIYDKVIAPFLTTRDLILFDPRGTGFSKPAMECLEGETPGDCLRRLFADGHYVYAYSSVSMAEDLQDLRTTLGYDQWNLLGESYGTHVAQVTMREASEGLRSVILDSVVPIVLPELPQGKSSFNVSMQRLVDHCAADHDCNANFPRLYSSLVKAVKHLNQTPIPLKTNCYEKEINFTLTGERLTGMLYEALYEAEMIPYLPYAITAAAEGNDYSFWNRVVCWEVVIDDILTDGAHWAVQCSDGRLANECNNWPVVVEQTLVKSDIPVLILNGEFDPVTPLEYGHSLAPGLPNSYVFDFPGMGHWVNGTGYSCQSKIIQGFLDSPNQDPDSSCLAGMNDMAFVLTAESP